MDKSFVLPKGRTQKIIFSKLSENSCNLFIKGKIDSSPQHNTNLIILCNCNSVNNISIPSFSLLLSVLLFISKTYIEICLLFIFWTKYFRPKFNSRAPSVVSSLTNIKITSLLIVSFK